MKSASFGILLCSLYIVNFRKELLPVLRDSALVNPGAELYSDDLDELSDTESISSNSDLDQDANDSDMESEKDEEEVDSGQYEVKNKREPTNTISVNDNDSDIEDAPSKKHSKTEIHQKVSKIYVYQWSERIDHA